MKKLSFALSLVMLASCGFSQKLNEKDLPEGLVTSFQKQYPSASHVKWEKEGANFEAEFDLNKVEQSVVFDTKGNMLEMEKEIQVSELPKGVAEYVTKMYKGAKIKEAAMITSSDGTVSYEAEIKDMDILFDSEGKFMKEVKD